MVMRIAGINIPNKRMAVALTAVYGIGASKAKDILAEAKISLDKKANDLSADEENVIRKLVEELKIEEVRGEFADTDELHAFYECIGPASGLSDEDRVYFANLPTTSDEALAHDLRTYRIAKQICVDRRPEHDDMMQAYRLLKQGEINDVQFDCAIRQYVSAKNEQTLNLIKNK
jgi:ribosomal protein S13